MATFSLNDIGRLVRPKVLTKTYLYPTSPSPPPIEAWWVRVRPWGRDPISIITGQPLDTLFKGLSLGDLTSQQECSYVGVVTSLLVKVNEHVFHVTTTKQAQSFTTHVKILALGVTFYGGIKEGKCINPWQGSTAYVWFYIPEDVIPLEAVIRFESIEVGDMVCFRTIRGLAITVHCPNKPRFYNTSSWSGKVVRLLHGNGIRIIKVDPLRKFTIVKPTVKGESVRGGER